MKENKYINKIVNTFNELKKSGDKDKIKNFFDICEQEQTLERVAQEGSPQDISIIFNKLKKSGDKDKIKNFFDICEQKQTLERVAQEGNSQDISMIFNAIKALSDNDIKNFFDICEQKQTLERVAQEGNSQAIANILNALRLLSNQKLSNEFMEKLPKTFTDKAKNIIEDINNQYKNLDKLLIIESMVFGRYNFDNIEEGQIKNFLNGFDPKAEGATEFNTKKNEIKEQLCNAILDKNSELEKQLIEKLRNLNKEIKKKEAEEKEKKKAEEEAKKKAEEEEKKKAEEKEKKKAEEKEKKKAEEEEMKKAKEELTKQLANITSKNQYDNLKKINIDFIDYDSKNVSIQVNLDGSIEIKENKKNKNNVLLTIKNGTFKEAIKNKISGFKKEINKFCEVINDELNEVKTDNDKKLIIKNIVGSSKSSEEYDIKEVDDNKLDITLKVKFFKDNFKFSTSIKDKILKAKKKLAINNFISLQKEYPTICHDNIKQCSDFSFTKVQKLTEELNNSNHLNKFIFQLEELKEGNNLKSNIIKGADIENLNTLVSKFNNKANITELIDLVEKINQVNITELKEEVKGANKTGQKNEKEIKENKKNIKENNIKNEFLKNNDCHESIVTAVKKMSDDLFNNHKQDLENINKALKAYDELDQCTKDLKQETNNILSKLAKGKIKDIKITEYENQILQAKKSKYINTVKKWSVPLLILGAGAVVLFQKYFTSDREGNGRRNIENSPLSSAQERELQQIEHMVQVTVSSTIWSAIQGFFYPEKNKTTKQ